MLPRSFMAEGGLAVGGDAVRGTGIDQRGWHLDGPFGLDPSSRRRISMTTP